MRVLSRSTWIILALLVSCTYDANTPNLEGQDVHLTVVHTADIHSRILPYYYTPNRFDQENGDLPDLEPFGGAARLKTLLDREKANSSRFIHVDSGDWFEGAPIFNAFSGEPETRAMSLLDVDVAALGNHEFDRGPVNLAAQISNWATFPILAANYDFDDPFVPGNNDLGALIKPYTILDVDGLKVGVIGLGNVSSITQLVQGGNSLGIRPIDTDQTVEYYADLLRPQVDILLAVSHLGLDEDETTATTNQGLQAATATQVRGDVDVIFGGHLHIVLNPPKQVPIYVNGKETNRSTVLVHSGAFAKTLGRLDLVVHVNTPQEMAAQYEANKAVALATGNPIPQARRGYVKAYDYKVVPVTARQPLDGQWCANPNEDASGQACTPTANKSGPYGWSTTAGYCRIPAPDGNRVPCDTNTPSCTGPGDQCLPCSYCHIPEDGEVLNVLEPYALAMNSNPAYELTRTFAYDTLPGYGILRYNYSGGDSQLGNLVADAMRLQPEVQADFSMTNTLGMRANVDPGPFTMEELYNVIPFDNKITVLYMSGTEVQQMFDFIASKSAVRGCMSQAQVSGMAWVMDCSVPAHTPSGASCDPALYQDYEDLGNCFTGAADLILIGSQRHCDTNAECTAATGGASDEVCGTSLGTCIDTGADRESKLSSRRACCVPGNGNTCTPESEMCPSGETCVPSQLHSCGKVLNPNAVYRAAVNDYVAAGGSGFTMLQFNTSQVNTGISLRQAFIDYIEHLDDPMYEGPYHCDPGTTPSEFTCHGAIRCDDPRWNTDPYLQQYNAVPPNVTYQYCPGKTTVGECAPGLICLLPHNDATDGRIQPRFLQ